MSRFFKECLFLCLFVILWSILGAIGVVICGTVVSCFIGWDKFWLLFQLNWLLFAGGFSSIALLIFLPKQWTKLIQESAIMPMTFFLFLLTGCATSAVAVGSSLIGVYVIGLVGGWLLFFFFEKD